MKAIVSTKSGSPEVLKLKEIEKPVPGDNEILIKIHAATVTRGDVFLRKIPRWILFPVGLIAGFKSKNIPGHELAGEIESIGREVQRFKVGDQVFGTTTGLATGANAQFICVPEEWKMGVIAKKPSNLTFEQAAAMPVGGMSALHLLRKGNISMGQKVLVYGASGSVGTYAVQLALHFGAEVTGVCSTSNMEMVSSLGAENVIDYTVEDFTGNGLVYDVILDAVGKISKTKCKHSVKKTGSFLTIKSLTKEKTDELNYLKELAENGKIKPVIDKMYPLEQVVEAHKYVELGHKKGNVVITIKPS